MINVSIVTLGCSKNDVDSDQMRSLLDENKYSFVKTPYEADAVIVNTCGFIEQAKEESIDTILELAQLKKTHNLKKLLLAGCLAQRYPDELLESIPEADGVIGTGYLKSVNEALDTLFSGEKVKFTEVIDVPYLEGVYKDNPEITEYVKISEGCNNNCTYCIIPFLKGRNRSRRIEDIVDEVIYLTDRGTKEILLIGQNTTDYGIDLYGEYKLKDLLYELRVIDKLKWIRILYAYPENFTHDLIQEIQENPKVLPYIDIPLQHVSDNVLKNMGRKTNKKEIISLIKRIREKIPNIVIRTTFMVGFPGETEEDFEELLDFIQEYPIDKLGCFSYSQEEGTKAAERTDIIEEDIRLRRQEELMHLQEKISSRLLLKHIDKVIECLVLEKVEEGLYLGRTSLDAPDVDGFIYIKSNVDVRINEFINVKIIDSMEFDLVGEYNEYSK